MLQDLEAGRPLELEAVVGAALELGERLGMGMPATRAVYACTKLRAAVAKAVRAGSGGGRSAGARRTLGRGDAGDARCLCVHEAARGRGEGVSRRRQEWRRGTLGACATTS